MLDLYVESGGKKLRCGYTTGSCATAAAKAATYILFNEESLDNIEIDTPKGILLNIEVKSIEVCEEFVKVSIIKDAGDDSDVTNGIEICAMARRSNTKFTLKGGDGVGLVTKDGLFVEKGEYAINPTPKRMIEKEVLSVLPEGEGVEITITVPEGSKIAKKTFNPRLGIKDGISILGTTGIVYPMSEEALKESIRVEIRQKALNKDRLVLTFGNIGERCAKAHSYEEEEIVIISNFVGFALECCVALKVKEVVLVGHIGKISKVAYGCFNTHSRVSDIRLEVIALELALLGENKELIEEVLKEKTSEGAVKLLGNGYDLLFKNIGDKIKNRMEFYTYGEIKCEAIMYYGFSDFHILYNSLREQVK